MTVQSNDAAAPGRRGASVYFIASAVAQVCALVRYVLLARMLGPEQLGVAATLVLTASFFDLISDTGGDRFLIQDKDGDEVPAQQLVQLVFVLRGCATAAALIAFAWPVAAFYKTPALAGGLAGLAIPPLIAGFMHLDLQRAQRHNDFRAAGLADLTSEILGLLATVIAAYLLRNFTAVIYGLITRSLVMVVVSHLTAKRTYSLRYSQDHAPRLARFAAPLMFNGLILFLGGQGDRVVVGRRVGLKGLGHYSAVLLLIYYPSAMIQRYVHAIYLPLIAGAQRNLSQKDRVSGMLGGQTLLLALLMSAGFAILAPFMVVLLYGRAFSQPVSTIALIGVLQASRFLTLWPTTVALAMGQSGIVLASNVVRLLAWPAALAGVALIGGVSGIVVGFLVGELAGFVTALLMLNRFEKSAPFHGFDRFVAYVVASACILGWTYAPGSLSIVSFLSLLAFSLVLMTWIVRSEIVTIKSAIHTARRFVAHGS